MPKPPTEPVEYDHHYRGVPRLGTVIFSPEAVTGLERDGVTPEELAAVLTKGTDHKSTLPKYSKASGYRDFGGIRLVLRTRPHMKGAAVVCIDGYRVKS